MWYCLSFGFNSLYWTIFYICILLAVNIKPVVDSCWSLSGLLKHFNNYPSLSDNTPDYSLPADYLYSSISKFPQLTGSNHHLTISNVTVTLDKEIISKLQDIQEWLCFNYNFLNEKMAMYSKHSPAHELMFCFLTQLASGMKDHLCSIAPGISFVDVGLVINIFIAK